MITTDVQNGLRIITLDRPERRNALTRDGLTELQELLAQSSEPVVYLSGAGEAFCAGADLDVVSGLDAEQAATFARLGQRVARTLETYDGVVVAGIDGPARGGGVELALACDLRIGTPAATFAESGVALGLFGAWGGTARLPRIVGEGVAMDISVSGRVIDAEEALQSGLISRVVDDPRAVANSLLACEAQALRVIKHRIRDDGGIAEQEASEAAAFASLVNARNDSN